MSNAHLQLLLIAVLFAAIGVGGAGGCGGGGGGGGGGNSAAPSATVAGGSLQDTIERGVQRGVDGISLTVLERGGTLRSHMAGRRQIAAGTVMTADAVFKMASVSKLYVAAAVTQLVQQGLLALDDSIAMHLPEIAARIENGDSITLRLLLQHRSGVPDFDSQAGFDWRDPHTDVDTVLAYALDLPADFPPDNRFEYSNTNYLLLGKVMDAVLGYSHHQHIQAFILDPLGLADTYHLLSQVGAATLVHGYWDGRDTTQLDYVIPGGSMLATGADIAVFLDALARGKLFDHDAQATYESVYWLNHSGWLPGYQTIARFESGLDVTVVLHINNTGGESEAIIGETYDAVIAFLRN